MKNNITLNIDHSEKTRAEHFLNKVNGDLEQIPFDAQEFSPGDDNVAGFKFKDKGQSTFITVIFAASYFHADEIRSANSRTRPNIRWTINGALLFGVESADEHLSSEILSLFAGKE